MTNGNEDMKKLVEASEKEAPYTEEQLNNMSEEEIQAVLEETVTKGEVIQLVRNLVGIELDAFQKFIGEPLRVMSMQNLALIELVKDKGLIKDDNGLQRYFDLVREKMDAEAVEKSDKEENGDSNKEAEEQPKQG